MSVKWTFMYARSLYGSDKPGSNAGIHLNGTKANIPF